ncbi:MAG TPA: hypothetical protein VHN15_07525, partial [Thermoanaerobaculia bacterium]|nr:hypothetical protein [Thermoanaerobaculia bacterium]
AQLALGNLKELTPLLVELSQFIPKVVLKELAFEGYSIETTVGEQASRNTHEAWQPSNTGATAGAFGSTGGSFNR